MCDATTLFKPVVTTFHVNVLPSGESVNVPVPAAVDALGVGRSFAPLRVAENVCVPGSVVPPPQPTPIASATDDKTNHFVRVIFPPLERLNKQDTAGY